MNLLKLIPNLINKIAKNEKDIIQVQDNIDNIDLELYYDKSAETCQYYINGTLIYTLDAVNLTNTTLLPIWKLISNSSSQTTLRRLCIVDLYWSLEQ